MVIQLHTSFIPKRPQVLAPESGAARKPANLYAISALVLFLLSAALSGAVFAYRVYLVRAISAMDLSLAAARKSFEPEFINEASRLHARIEAAKQLFAQHRAPSLIFDLLEKKTLESVRFRDFSFDARTQNAALLSLTGEAQSFNAVALQSDVFGADPIFQNPVFSNFALNERGNVVFNFRTSLDLDRILYRETLVGAAAKDNEPFSGENGEEEFLEGGE